MKDISDVIDKAIDNVEKSFDSLSDAIYKKLNKEVAEAENVKIIQVGNSDMNFSLLDRLLYFAVGFAVGFLIQQYLMSA